MIRSPARPHTATLPTRHWACWVALLLGITSAACGTRTQRTADVGSVQTTPNDTGPGGSAAGSRSVDDCRGPGRYESGKEGSYRPCCPGLTEVPYLKPGYAGAFSTIPTCAQLPLRVYACVRGTCGDGICEEGEAPACGCVEDCPQAAWESTGDPKLELGKLEATPASCHEKDLLARLQTSPAAIDCGDVPLDASSDARSDAIACARAAFGNHQPFDVFWYAPGIDSVVHQGRVGRPERDGAFVVYSVHVDEDAYGIAFPGATASWRPCQLAPGITCEGSLDECFACDYPSGYPECGCLPEGPRPGAPAGSEVEVQCEAR